MSKQCFVMAEHILQRFELYFSRISTRIRRAGRLFYRLSKYTFPSTPFQVHFSLLSLRIRLIYNVLLLFLVSARYARRLRIVISIFFETPLNYFFRIFVRIYLEYFRIYFRVRVGCTWFQFFSSFISKIRLDLTTFLSRDRVRKKQQFFFILFSRKLLNYIKSLSKFAKNCRIFLEITSFF